MRHVIDIDSQDHLPLVASILLPAREANPDEVNRKAVGYDKSKLADEACKDLFGEALRVIPPILVGCDVMSHCHLAHSYLGDAMCKQLF